MSIKYPITVQGINLIETKNFRSGMREVGIFVSVRPCGDEYGKKTYLGVYLGDVATGASAFFNKGTGILEVGSAHYNPAIYIPDLKKVVFGYESWWGKINSADDLRQITDEDIGNVWYVQALKQLTESPKQQE